MYSKAINDKQRYEFSSNTGLSLVTEGEPDKDGVAKDKCKYIANVWPEVNALVEVIKDGVIDPYIRFTPEYQGGITEGKPVTKPLKGLEKLNWPTEVDIHCILNPDVPKVNEHLANIIRLQLKDATLEKTTIVDRVGTQFVEGIPMACEGSELIWPDGLGDKPNVIFEPLPNIRLVFDPDCSEQEADAGMKRIIDLTPEAGRIVFSQHMLYLQRAAFMAAGVTPKCVVFLHGYTGSKKTTYASFQQLYNRDEPLEPKVRFNASLPAVTRLLYEKDDDIFVIDDFFKSGASDVNRQQEKTLFEIVRIIGDGIEPARVRGKEVANKPPKRGVLITGEIYIGASSDAARIFPVHITTPIDDDKMSECQREPLMLSTFYRYYIKWFITNFDAIVSLIKEWLTMYRSTKTGIHARIQETQFCLEAAYKLYLTYREEKGFISSETSLADYGSYYHQLRAIAIEQNARVNQHQSESGKPVKIDYLALIRSMYNDKRFRLVDKAKWFDKDEHDGVIHGEYLYLRRERLIAKIRSFERSADLGDVIESLKKQQALKTSKGGNTRQIHGCNGNFRFFAIPLSKLR